jgi:hypothetical protein
MELLFANARLKEKLQAFVHEHSRSNQLFFSAWLVYRSIQCRRDLARSCKQGAEKVAVEREVSSVSTHSSERAEINEARTRWTIIWCICLSIEDSPGRYQVVVTPVQSN